MAGIAADLIRGNTDLIILRFLNPGTVRGKV